MSGGMRRVYTRDNQLIGVIQRIVDTAVKLDLPRTQIINLLHDLFPEQEVIDLVAALEHALPAEYHYPERYRS